jgi:hypothetical protein
MLDLQSPEKTQVHFIIVVIHVLGMLQPIIIMVCD